MNINQDHLNLVLQFLQQSTSMKTNEDNIRVMEMYNQIIQYSDYVPCLLHVISNPNYSPFKAISCIFLRQSISQASSIDPVLLTNTLLPLLFDHEVRPTAANAISTTFGLANSNFQKNLLTQLNNIMTTTDQLSHLEGALTVISMILDDHCRFLLSQEFQMSFNDIFSTIYALLQHQHHNIRYLSVQCINSIILTLPDLPNLIQTILPLTNDPQAPIRALVSQILLHMVNCSPDIVSPFIKDIIKQMLQLINDPFESVKLQACNLIKLLLPHTLITDDEIATFSDDSIYDSLEGDSSLTLRKAVGMTLDEMAMNFGTDFLLLFYPYVLQLLKSNEWKHQEAAVFIFGCVVAKGWTELNANTIQQSQLILRSIISLLDTNPFLQHSILWGIFRVGENVDKLLPENELFQFVNIIVQLTNSPNSRVKYQSFILLGQFIDYDYPFLQQYLPSLLQLHVQNIKEPSFVGAKVIENISAFADVQPSLFNGNLQLLQQLIPTFLKFASNYPNLPTILDTAIYNISYILPRFGECAAPITQPIAAFAIQTLSNAEGDLMIQSSCILLLSSIISVNPPLTQTIYSEVQTQFPKFLRYLKSEMITASYGLLVKENLTPIMENLLFVLQYGSLESCSNVFWSLGIILCKFLNDMKPVYNQIVDRIASELKTSVEKYSVHIRRNMLTCLGRIAYAQPELLQQCIGAVCFQLLKHVNELGDSESTTTVLFGLSKAICLNPQACEQALPVIVKIYDPNSQSFDILKEVCVSVIQLLKRTFNSKMYEALWVM
ncbi:HEAT repeat domain containing protein [Entamoeba marina]